MDIVSLPGIIASNNYIITDHPITDFCTFMSYFQSFYFQSQRLLRFYIMDTSHYAKNDSYIVSNILHTHQVVPVIKQIRPNLVTVTE